MIYSKIIYLVIHRVIEDTRVHYDYCAYVFPTDAKIKAEEILKSLKKSLSKEDLENFEDNSEFQDDGSWWWESESGHESQDVEIRSINLFVKEEPTTTNTGQHTWPGSKEVEHDSD